MSTWGSRARTIGLTVILGSASAGMHFGAGGVGSLLSFLGVLVGASLVAVGIGMANGPTPIVPAIFASARRALAAFVRRNTATVGLVMASCAVTVVSGEDDPTLCFGMFALLLLGLALINIVAVKPLN